jgi:hypothetical protein
MTNPEILATLIQKAREVTVAVGNLHRYELQVEKGQQEQNDAFYAALETEVKNAQSALRLIRAAIGGKSAAELSPQDIQDIRRVAQEEAIGAIAEALNWTWEAANNRWRTPDGTFYTATGEQIG